MQRQRNYIYPDKESMVSAFLSEVQLFLEEVAAAGKPVHIAFSGGFTPLLLFSKLAELTKRDEWSGVHIYWVDERCVPPEDEESNFGAAFNTILSPLGLPRDQIHQILGEEDPQQEAERYAKHLSEYINVVDGFPVFDWIWLGLGSDGHTASIFPHQIDLWRSEEYCVVASHPETGQKRISLSGGVINAAKRVSFMATGKEKSTIIKQIIMKQGNYLDYPAFYVNPGSDHLEWFLDQDAANLL